MIVICGATGRIGGAAARALRSRDIPVKALVRAAGKAASLAARGCTLAIADLHDEPAVTDAFRGADRVLVICPVGPGADDVAADCQRMIEVIGAAIDVTRPRAVVAISDYGAHLPAGTGVTMILHRLEERLRAIPVTTTFVRSAEHMQNWLRQLPAARARGVLPSLHHPVTRPFPTVSAVDVGVVAAELLAGPFQSSATPRVLHVEGPRRYAAADVAAVFTRQLGRPITARELPRDEWEKALAGLGASYAHLVAELQDVHNEGLIDVEPGDEVRRSTTELAEALG